MKPFCDPETLPLSHLPFFRCCIFHLFLTFHLFPLSSFHSFFLLSSHALISYFYIPSFLSAFPFSYFLSVPLFLRRFFSSFHTSYFLSLPVFFQHFLPVFIFSYSSFFPTFFVLFFPCVSILFFLHFLFFSFYSFLPFQWSGTLHNFSHRRLHCREASLQELAMETRCPVSSCHAPGSFLLPVSKSA